MQEVIDKLKWSTETHPHIYQVVCQNGTSIQVTGLLGTRIALPSCNLIVDECVNLITDGKIIWNAVL